MICFGTDKTIDSVFGINADSSFYDCARIMPGGEGGRAWSVVAIGHLGTIAYLPVVDNVRDNMLFLLLLLLLFFKRYYDIIGYRLSVGYKNPKENSHHRQPASTLFAFIVLGALCSTLVCHACFGCWGRPARSCFEEWHVLTCHELDCLVVLVYAAEEGRGPVDVDSVVWDAAPALCIPQVTVIFTTRFLRFGRDAIDASKCRGLPA